MSPVAIASIVLACIFGGALAGMALRSLLPEHHLAADTKDVVKVAMGLVGTMAALLLGLLVASAKSSYDLKRSELTQMSASFLILDRMLAHYGPETKEEREMLRGFLTELIERTWSQHTNDASRLDPSQGSHEIIYDRIQQLTPKNDAQRALQSQALSTVVSVGQIRWLLFEQSDSSISTPLLVVMVLWLSILFASFGLFAPRNMTVMVSLLLAALSVSGAIFLIIELDRPFAGLIQISSAPLRSTLAHLGR